jgi:hypothetical protein
VPARRSGRAAVAPRRKRTAVALTLALVLSVVVVAIAIAVGRSERRHSEGEAGRRTNPAEDGP